MAQDIIYDESKFTELLLYVAKRMLGDPSNGSVKRNKVMFFSDFFHYARYGTPITGVDYVASRLGPTPRGLVGVQQHLIENGEALLHAPRTGQRVQNMLIAQREPDLSRFAATEISMVEDVIRLLRDNTGMEASEISHTMQAWKIRKQGDKIPYHAALIFEGPVSIEEENIARDVAERLRPELERVGAA